MEVGTRCRVISDDYGFFEPGEIVVVLDSDRAPFCAKESAYSPEKQWMDYEHNECAALKNGELEVIEE